MSEPSSAGGRQFVRFVFFKVDPAWRRLPAEDREQGRKEFAEAVRAAASRVMVRPYSTTGTRGDTDFFLWQSARSLEELEEVHADLVRTSLAGWLTTPYSYLAMTKPSQYVGAGHAHPGQEGTRTRVRPVGRRYLFVYPMTKLRSWYGLAYEDRRRIMEEHFKIGHRYPRVKINTTYSFGLDDQEFVVAFEADHPEDFLELVEELRGSESSQYTERDVPIFTGVAADIEEVLARLG